MISSIRQVPDKEWYCAYAYTYCTCSGKNLPSRPFTPPYPKLTPVIGINAMLWYSRSTHPPINQPQQPSTFMPGLQISQLFPWNGFMLPLKRTWYKVRRRMCLILRKRVILIAPWMDCRVCQIPDLWRASTESSPERQIHLFRNPTSQWGRCLIQENISASSCECSTWQGK